MHAADVARTSTSVDLASETSAPRREPPLTAGVEDVRLDLDLEAGLLSVGEEELLRELLDQMVETWQRGAARVAAATEEGGPDKGAAVAHALWGVAATLGAVRVRDCAARLEKCLQSKGREGFDRELRDLDEALRRFAGAVDAARSDRAAG